MRAVRVLPRRILLLLLWATAACTFAPTVMAHAPTHTPAMPRAATPATLYTALQIPTSASDYDGQPQPTLDPSDPSDPYDPMLALMPDFIWSMPVQVLLQGICMALAVVLSVHLAFTGRYHYPLSKVNFVMQAFSCLCLVVSVSCDTGVLLHTMSERAHRYPYMFPYINMEIPPPTSEWSDARVACYTILQAIMTLAAHTTHIQFLTLLYPSNLERRLILWMLGPLALCAAALLFADLAPAEDEKAADLADAFRNICNSTLSLLYLCALAIWGLWVNRRRAWRTDGGTAIFGAGASGLAFVTALLNFLGIKWDRLWWLPQISWTLTVWQSWLGFWWWVGAGMGILEVEDREMRAAKKAARKAQVVRMEQGELGEGEGTSGHEEDESPGSDQGSHTGSGDEAGSDQEEADGRSHRSHRSHLSARSTSERSSRSAANLPPIAAMASSTSLAHALSNRASVRSRTSHHPVRSTHSLHRTTSHPTARRSTDPSVNGAAPTRTATQGSDAPHPETSGPTTLASTLASAARSIPKPAFITERFRRLRVAHLAAARSAATQQTALRDQVLSKRQRRRARLSPEEEEQDPEFDERDEPDPYEEGSAAQEDRIPDEPSRAPPRSRSRSRSRSRTRRRRPHHAQHHHHHHAHHRRHRRREHCNRAAGDEDYTLPPATPPPSHPSLPPPTDETSAASARPRSLRSLGEDEAWITTQLDLLAQDEVRRAARLAQRLRAERLEREVAAVEGREGSLELAAAQSTPPIPAPDPPSGTQPLRTSDAAQVDQGLTAAAAAAAAPPSDQPTSHSRNQYGPEDVQPTSAPPTPSETNVPTSLPVRSLGARIVQGANLLPFPDTEPPASDDHRTPPDHLPPDHLPPDHLPPDHLPPDHLPPDQRTPPVEPREDDPSSRTGTSWNWRGPLGRARLRDRTTYDDV